MRLDAIPGLMRDGKRLQEIVSTLGRFGLAPWIKNVNINWLQKHFQAIDGQQISDLTAGQRLREAFTELGTTFIKLGQILSTRPDLAGPEITDELAKLQSSTPADPPETIRKIVETELGATPEELFLEFNDQAAASASIGQVHFAKLQDGTPVVVKIQHPGIEGKIRSDLEILKGLAELAEQYSDQAKQFRPKDTINEFARTLLAELDFSRERNSLEKFAQNFDDDHKVVIPKPYPTYSTSRVLTMDRLDGLSLAHAKQLGEQGHDLGDIAVRGANIFLEMIFRDGLYHADPHPGNIFVLGDSAIGLLDFGMVGRIDDQLREKFEDLMLSLSDKDSQGICDTICELGAVPRELNRDDLRREIEDFLADNATQSLDELDLGGALNRMMEIIRDFHIVLPSRVSLLIKVLVMLEGTARGLNPKFSLAEILRPYQSRIVRRRLAPDRLMKKAKQYTKDWTRLAEMAPRELADILAQVKRGQFDVHLEHRKLDSVANRVVMGVLIAALFVGSSLILSFNVPPTIKGVSVFGAFGCIVAFTMGFRLVRAIQKSGNIISK